MLGRRGWGWGGVVLRAGAGELDALEREEVVDEEEGLSFGLGTGCALVREKGLEGIGLKADGRLGISLAWVRECP